MYYVIVDYDHGQHFDVYREKDTNSMTCKVNEIIESLTSTFFGRDDAIIEVIEDNHSTVKHFERDEANSGKNTVFKEI